MDDAAESNLPAALEEFLELHGDEFEALWGQVPNPRMNRIELAERLSRIVMPAKTRLDKSAFAEMRARTERLRLFTIPQVATARDAVHQGIVAAEAARKELNLVMGALALLDSAQTAKVAEYLRRSNSGTLRETDNYFNALLIAAAVSRELANALRDVTGVTTKPRRGCPPLPYTGVVNELMTLWEELTGRPVVYPKSSSAKPGETKKTISAHICNQFVYLGLKMCVPDVELEQTETSIRNVRDLRKQVLFYEPGDEIDLDVIRAQQQADKDRK